MRSGARIILNDSTSLICLLYTASCVTRITNESESHNGYKKPKVIPGKKRRTGGMKKVVAAKEKNELKRKDFDSHTLAIDGCSLSFPCTYWSVREH